MADHLRTAIGRERLQAGDQLPSEAQLMAHYGVARMTARNALRLHAAFRLVPFKCAGYPLRARCGPD